MLRTRSTDCSRLVAEKNGYLEPVIAAFLSAFFVIASVALAYFANPIVPIFMIAVLGPPVTAFILNRSPRGRET